MADEITAQFYLKFDKTNATPQMSPSSQSVDVTGSNYAQGTQEIGTSAEAIRLGDIGTPGYIMAHNLDSTNYIEIGYDDTGFKPTVKLKPDEWALFRLAPATPQAKADTAACDLEYLLIED